MKLCLWDHVAKEFYKKFTSSDLALSSMSSSRVFINKDIQPTIDYFNWLVIVETPALYLSIPISVLFRLS
ncbi:hypothetical protein YC2023_018796 [Brassica napus]